MNSPAFVGRARELTVLDQALEQADGGAPAVLLVGGEARRQDTPVTEFAARGPGTAPGAGSAAACRSPGGLPFAPGSRPSGPGRAARVEQSDPGRAVLAGAGPLLPARGDPDRAGPPPHRPEANRQFRCSSWCSACSPPWPRAVLVLVVEDVHWADRSTRNWPTWPQPPPPAGRPAGSPTATTSGHPCWGRSGRARPRRGRSRGARPVRPAEYGRADGGDPGRRGAGRLGRGVFPGRATRSSNEELLGRPRTPGPASCPPPPPTCCGRIRKSPRRPGRPSGGRRDRAGGRRTGCCPPSPASTRAARRGPPGGGRRQAAGHPPRRRRLRVPPRPAPRGRPTPTCCRASGPPPRPVPRPSRPIPSGPAAPTPPVAAESRQPLATPPATPSGPCRPRSRRAPRPSALMPSPRPSGTSSGPSSCGWRCRGRPS